MPYDYKELLSEIKDGITELAKNTVEKYKDAAIADSKEFLSHIEENLKKWTDLLAQKKITTAEYEWLLQSQKEYLKMDGLKLAGLAEIRAAQFAGGILNLIANTAFKFLEQKVGPL
ncbi:MAG: hypothetical protein JWN78_402 [Bacteroidota bacterium]|nr:hypothetical protein [Bacteroidota bacterium]